MKKNVHIWVWHKGLVKLSLEPGEVLAYRQSYDNGEGTTCEGAVIHHEGTHLKAVFFSMGNDCDGHHSSVATAICGLDAIAALPDPEEQGVLLPNWQTLDTEQRDAFAESMNY
jgi:hypothetical protein